MNLVDVAKSRLNGMRSELGCNDLVNQTKCFANENNLSENDFKIKRPRIVKYMAGEQARDELAASPLDQFRTDVYYRILDTIISSIESRFCQSRDLLKDLSLLSPERMMSFKNENEIPDDGLRTISKWISIEHTQLKNEYVTFSKSLHELIKGMNLTTTISRHEQQKLSQSDNDTDDSEMSEENGEIIQRNITSWQVLKILTSYDLLAAFPNLYIAYKALGTIPVSSASAERSFSKVKLIKTRLRSTTNQYRLERLLMLSMERDVPINHQEVIDKFAQTSDFLRKKLMFK